MRKTICPKGILGFNIKSALPAHTKKDEQKAWNHAFDEMVASIEKMILIEEKERDHMIPFEETDQVIEIVMKTIHLAEFEQGALHTRTCSEILR